MYLCDKHGQGVYTFNKWSSKFQKNKIQIISVLLPLWPSLKIENYLGKVIESLVSLHILKCIIRKYSRSVYSKSPVEVQNLRYGQAYGIMKTSHHLDPVRLGSAMAAPPQDGG